MLRNAFGDTESGYDVPSTTSAAIGSHVREVSEGLFRAAFGVSQMRVAVISVVKLSAKGTTLGEKTHCTLEQSARHFG